MSRKSGISYHLWLNPLDYNAFQAKGKSLENNGKHQYDAGWFLPLLPFYKLWYQRTYVKRPGVIPSRNGVFPDCSQIGVETAVFMNRIGPSMFGH
jgi:hypothetical protein